MTQHVVEVDAIATTTLLKAFETGMTWYPVLSLLQGVARWNIRQDSYLLGAAISACESCGAWDYAFHIQNAFSKDSNQQKPSAFLDKSLHAWNSCLAASAGASMWCLGLVTLDQLSFAKLQKDVVSCSSVLHACDIGKRWQRALHLFSDMLDYGPSPNVVASGAAISAASKSMRGGEWALKELKRMEMKQMQLNVVCLNAAMSACATSILWAECLFLLRVKHRMPSMVSFGAAISAFERVERWADALGFFAEALDRGLRASLVAVSSVLSACKHEAGQWKMAIQLTEAQKNQGKLKPSEERLWPPNLIMANALSSACEAAGQWQQCVDVLESLRKWRLQADEQTYGNIASSAASTSIAWEVSINVLKELSSQQLATDAVCLSSALGVCEAGRLQRAPSVLKMLENCGDRALRRICTQ